MAKRPTTRSKDTDAAAPVQPKPKRSRAATAAVPATPPPEMPAEASDANRASLSEPARTDEPSADDIRRRAYERYLERGGEHGQHFDDWFEAERELKNKK
jgi:hypothetical protein